MGLKKTHIDVNYLLSQVDEAQIFCHYFGEFSFGRTYSSVFRQDDTPSTGFYISQSGKIIYNDLATGEKYDCIDFVCKKFNIEYKDALYKIACDFGVIECEGVAPIKKYDINKTQLVSDELKRETIIKIQPDNWSNSYLDFWKQFSIFQEELEQNKIYPIKKLYINDNLIPNYSNNVRFAFIVEYDNVSYKKIYTPFAKNKKFKWISNVPLYIPFGFNSLPYNSDTLIITKAQKDRIIFKKYFTDVIGLQNESIGALKQKTINYLKKRYKRIFINTDLDSAGKKALEHYTSIGFEPLMLPDLFYEKYGIKDVGDFVKEYGIERFEKFLKYNNLL